MTAQKHFVVTKFVFRTDTPTGPTGPKGAYEGTWYTYMEASYGFDGLFSVLEINQNYAAGMISDSLRPQTVASGAIPSQLRTSLLLLTGIVCSQS